MRVFPRDIVKKSKSEKIVMLTAYDSTFARIAEDAGVDILLVGDSLGMVIQGKENTLSVSVDDIIYHTKCVVNGTKKVMVVADMPFLSYQASISQAVLNCGRVLKEGRAQAVKIEGGLEIVDTVRTLTETGIPVIAHIGLRPQAINQQGGYRIQGKDTKTANELIKVAKCLEKAGAFSLLLEGVEPNVSEKITKSVNIPTIGIASGKHCNGQVLVIYDMLGLNPDFNPSFLKKYVDGYAIIKNAISDYSKEIRKE